MVSQATLVVLTGDCYFCVSFTLVTSYCDILRWFDWIFFLGGGNLPSLSINYVGISKDMGKRLPQLYYIEMKISYDLGFTAIGVAMAT